jgi:hypothetical protein
MAKLEAIGIINSGSSMVFDTLKTPEMGLRLGELIEVAVPKPVIGKSKKIFATRSFVPVLDTCLIQSMSQTAGIHPYRTKRSHLQEDGVCLVVVAGNPE